MHLYDEVSSNFRLPVDEICLIPAISLEDITTKFLQQLVDVNMRYRAFLSLNYFILLCMY